MTHRPVTRIPGAALAACGIAAAAALLWWTAGGPAQ
ncbi:hypothetical protein AVHY2522_07230 [Acidovorax sp. SUPP2522]|nr:hypothetical protein AVHY2522_07230 [Acidovorax sp. SUPP2522]